MYVSTDIESSRLYNNNNNNHHGKGDGPRIDLLQVLNKLCIVLIVSFVYVLLVI